MNGIINVLKPPGMSSSGVVVYLRRVLGEKRIGHTGTLDPGAAGVLPICVGRSTRLSEYIMDHDKTYLAEVRFGVATDTLDTYGTVTRRQDCQISREALERVIPAFVGEILQTPPAYSAVKIGGQRAYALARKGVIVQKPPRKVCVRRLEILHQTGENRFMVRVVCSKGTYIRTLIADMGEALGVPAVMSFLLRESSGGYALADAYTLDELAEMAAHGNKAFLISPDSALEAMPAYNETNEFGLRNGQTLACRPDTPQGDFRVYCGSLFFGVGRRIEEGGYRLAVPLY